MFRYYSCAVSKMFLHMQFLTYHTHVVSLFSYIFRFRTRGLSQIPQIFPFSDITTLCIASDFMSKQVIGNHTCSLSQILRMCGFSYISHVFVL